LNSIPRRIGGAGVIRIGNRARAFGVLYASGLIENSGFIGGTAIAETFGCGGEGGRSCVPDGVFDRDSIPVIFRQSPFLDFGSPKRFVSLRRWVE